MEQIHKLFDDLGGAASVSRILNVKPSTASEMKRRGVIPVWYWKKLIAECKERGIRGINEKTLVDIHSPPDEEAAA